MSTEKKSSLGNECLSVVFLQDFRQFGCSHCGFKKAHHFIGFAVSGAAVFECPDCGGRFGVAAARKDKPVATAEIHYHAHPKKEPRGVFAWTPRAEQNVSARKRK